MMCVSYRAFHGEDMTVVFSSLQILGDVGEVIHVVPVLTCAEYVTNLMLTHHLLQKQIKNKTSSQKQRIPGR